MTLREGRFLGLLVLPAIAVIVLLGLSGRLTAGSALLSVLAIVVGSAAVWWKLRDSIITEAFEAEEAGDEDEPDAIYEEFLFQARLAESYETVLDAIPVPLLVVRADRRIVQANRAATELLGADPIDADLTTAIRHPEVLVAVHDVLAGEAAERTVEFSRAGSLDQTLIARVSELASARDGERRAVVTLADVTATRKAEEMRADFVANVSHELRTPLSTLVGFIDTLRGPARDDAAAREDFLSLMAEQGARMTRLVGDLLSLSQIEANEHSRPIARVSVTEVLAGVVRTLTPEADAREMNLAVRVPEDVPEVVGDADQLTQVFQNLVHNAIKYGRVGTEVEIAAAQRDDGRLAVSVTDRGEGIDEACLPRLTERFYRVDKARSRALGGTGLGLSIVKHILNRHQADLEIESTLGEGSIFTAVLPVAPLPSRKGSRKAS